MSDNFGNISIQQPVSPPKRTSGKRPSSRRKPSRKTARKLSRSTSKSWWWLIIPAGLFALYALAGFAGVPYYITKILPETVYRSTGLHFQPGNIHFNPLTFSFSTENIKLIPEDPNLPALLDMKSMSGKLAPLSLLRNELVSNSLKIDGLTAHITREYDSSYNFSSIFGPSSSDDESGIISFSSLPFHFSLNNINISGSNVVFSDLPRKKTHTIEDIQLALPTLSNFPFQAGNYIRPRFSATINGSPFELSGEAAVGDTGKNNHGTDLSCDIRSMDLPFYFGYLPFSLPLDFTRGKADGKIGFRFNPEKPKGNKLAISFDLKIDGAEMSTDSGTFKIAVPAAQLQGTLFPVSKHIQFESISLRDPLISSYGKSFSDNLRNIFSRGEKEEAPGRQSASATTNITRMIVDGGVLNIFQTSPSGRPDISWDALQFHLLHYNSSATGKNKDKPGSFRLTGEQQTGTAFFSWQGELSPADTLAGTLTINNIQTGTLFRAFDITPFAASKGMADLKGRFSLSLKEAGSWKSFLKLKDTTIAVQNFILTEDNSTILASPLVKITDFSNSRQQTDFGTVTIQNGTLNLKKEKLPQSFSLFNNSKSKKYLLNSLSFQGNATLSSAAGKNKKIHFPLLKLKAENFYKVKEKEKNISIIATGKKDAAVKADGRIILSPFKLSLETEFSSLQPGAVLSWFTESSALADIGGSLEGKGTFSLPGAGFKGDLNIRQGFIKDKNKQILHWENGIFQGIHTQSNPARFTVSQIKFKAPSFSWTIDSDDNTPLESFKDILQKYLPKTAKLSEESFNIGEIVVQNGRIDVKDGRVSPPWQGIISDFNGTISGLDYDKKSGESQFQFGANLDDSSLSIKGRSNLLSRENNGTFSFSLTEFPLTAFQKQFGSQLEIDTDRGTFNLQLDSSWQDAQLSNSGTVNFSGIDTESKISDSALTLALLTDGENSFNIDFSFTEPEPASQSPLLYRILTDFQKLVIKASVSPFLLASGDFTDLADSEYINFKPGESVISTENETALARYSQFLAANPNIGLVISGGYDLDTDTAAMVTQLESIELERVTAENKRRLKKWQGQKELYRKTLEQRQKKLEKEGKVLEMDIPPKFLQEFIPTQPQQVKVDENMLKELAEQRIQSVYRYFTDQFDLDPARISIDEDNRSSSFADSPAGRVSIAIKPLSREEQ
ncbi:MAG: DUF748 domain-containing protein [Deltaproteobacteria bacterium]|nr:DUF748 domain-containing protein [Deltaproteobacteria bacterium]